ncbi:ABC transporter substrate-binding protein [Clostridium estertheticum]|uniref:ABC transporter substrate-binding protein n=1 Tax=Clostridium estertheticum TaxID=238834 RepID=UPI0013E996D6|nr:ABC transporter substrate-binding protein [Clostridium estertheticum]MBZ9685966.1 ABC transporter substrate-binding protein [Clostridium estertheticum]
MYKTKKNIALAMALVMATSALFTGCGSKKAVVTKSEATKSEALKEVELSYYFPNTPQKNIEAVNVEFNKLVKAKINATVKLNIVDWGTYDQKMNVMMAGGDSYDLCFTATWANNFYQNVAKGAFKDLDKLIDQYAPKTKAVVPDTFWQVAKVKGKTYAVPNFQSATAGFGYTVQKPIADKYKFDWKAAKQWSDLTPLLEQVKKGDPNLIPFEYNKNVDPFLCGTILYGMEALGDSKTPGWIYLNDKSLKVVNQYDTPEFKDYIKLMRDWYQKGYLRKDASSLKDTDADRKVGKNAVQFGQIDLGTTDYEKAGMPSQGRMFAKSGIESYDVKFVEPVLTTDKAAASLTAISASSKNPERSMMLIELLNSDAQIANTINDGIEGKDYKKVAPNKIETIKDSGYGLQSPWEFGFMGLSWYSEGSPKGSEVDDIGNKMWEDLNKNATPSPALGFVFSMDNVKTEVANCNNVIEELYYAISTGTVDPDKFQPELVAKLKTAGLDKVIAEKQVQLDAWKKTNGK